MWRREVRFWLIFRHRRTLPGSPHGHVIPVDVHLGRLRRSVHAIQVLVHFVLVVWHIGRIVAAHRLGVIVGWSHSRRCSSGHWKNLQLLDAAAEMLEHVHTGSLVHLAQEVGNLSGALSESGPELIGVGLVAASRRLPTHVLQMAYGQLENVGLFQFRNIFPFLQERKTR